MTDVVATFLAGARTVVARVVLPESGMDLDTIALYLTEDAGPDVDPDVDGLASFTLDGATFEPDPETGHWVAATAAVRYTIADRFGGAPR